MTRARRARVGLALVSGSLLLAGCGAGVDDSPREAPAQPSYGVIGDSYSNGEGLGPSQAWPDELARRTGVELAVNPAVSGWTTEQALAEELPRFEAADPDVASLLIGANDLVQGVPRPVFRERFRRLLAAMARVVGGARRVVVVTVPDFSRKPAGQGFGDPALLSREIARRNAIIREESRRQGAPVADVFGVSRRPTDPSPDGLHPSAAELAAWTDTIEPVARRAWGLD